MDTKIEVDDQDRLSGNHKDNVIKYYLISREYKYVVKNMEDSGHRRKKDE